MYSPLLVDIQCDDLLPEEQKVASDLGNRIMVERQLFLRLDLYYNGEQPVNDLGISTPPVMKGLHTITGWPGLVVDTLDERLQVEGFRHPSSTIADSDLWALWQANNLDQESQLAHLDALVFGRAFVMVGVGGPGGAPLITVESPENMAVRWDARTRQVVAALQIYEMDGVECASLFLPKVTIHMHMVLVPDPNDAAATQRKGWVIDSRDTHQLGRTPVVMLANRARANDRYGRSEITPAVQSITDAACRTLLGLEAGREFYSIPQRWALNVSEEAFQDANGNPVTKWTAAMAKVWALPPPEDTGPQPSVGQFSAMSPAVFTDIINMYAQIMSSVTGMPPHYLGQTTDNPASADAIRSAEARLNKRAERRQTAFSGAWVEAMLLALQIDHGGELPPDAPQIAATWASVATPTPLATSQAIVAQSEAGILPPTSDVTLERLGYTPGERQRIRDDAARSGADELLAQIAQSVQAKDERVAGNLAKQVTEPGGSAPGSAPPAGGGHAHGA